jgi:hypothetical protein
MSTNLSEDAQAAALAASIMATYRQYGATQSANENQIGDGQTSGGDAALAASIMATYRAHKDQRGQ